MLEDLKKVADKNNVDIATMFYICCIQEKLLDPPTEVLKDLEEQGFIKILEDGISKRTRFLEMFETKDSMFLEFWNTYPMKVPDGRGSTRILRPVNPESSIGKKCRDKYNSIIKGNPEKHKEIMACLDRQLKEERHKLQYLQQTQVWLNQRTYEKYLGLIDEIKEESDGGYGETFV